MSNLLKSKFLLGVMAVVVMFVGVVAVSATSASAANCSITTTLKQGSTGAEVVCLQTALGGLTADGKFGPATKSAVMTFQAHEGLVADGVFGPASRAAWLANQVTGNFPAGCTSASGFSTTTGMSCAVSSSFPAGCTSASGFSPTTGLACSGGSSSSDGPLSGGEGDVEISSTSTDVDDTVTEGDEDVKVLGFQVEAQDSDVELSSVRVSFENEGYDAGDGSSENLEKYVDEVTVWQGSTKVGSADMSDFSKDSDTPDQFSKSIELSGAIVREDDKAKFYIAVSAVSGIDEDDMEDAVINVTAESIRFEDATGAILTADVDEENDFDFEDVSESNEVEVKSSSANPDDMSVLVDESDNSDETLALAFKLEVDEDSQDVMVTSFPVVLTFDGLDTDNDGDITSETTTSDSAAENVVDSVVVKIGSEEYEAELDAVSINGTGDGTATYIVDFEDDEFTVEAGDEAEVKVYITFNDQDDNYNEGVTVRASVDNDDIEAETEDDEVAVDGSTKTGATLTLSLSAATVDVTATDSDKNEDNSVGTFSFTFTVEAEGEDVTFDANDVDYIVLGPTSQTATVNDSLTFISGDVDDEDGPTYTVSEGDSATFTLDVTITPADAGDNGVYRVRLDNVAGNDVGDDQTAGPETLSYVAP